MYDIIIIGAGTAGLSSAIYALRARKKVLVLESRVHGGQIINSHIVENYPGISSISGDEFSNKLLEHANKFGLEIKYEEVIEVKKNNVKTSSNSYECKSIIIATGTVNKKLGLENEEKLVGKGVSYCGFCDGNFYKDKVVAVIGGGNTALEDASYLSKICSKVYLIHRGNKFRAEASLVESLGSNVEIMFNSKVTKLIGDDKLTGIIVGDEKISVDGIFIAIGQMPDTDLFVDLIEIDNHGYVIATENCKTNVENIFVAGDVRTKEVRQLVTAASDGAVAAIKACEYVNKIV